jgi:hypothetical protein
MLGGTRNTASCDGQGYFPLEASAHSVSSCLLLECHPALDVQIQCLRQTSTLAWATTVLNQKNQSQPMVRRKVTLDKTNVQQEPQHNQFRRPT